MIARDLLTFYKFFWTHLDHQCCNNFLQAKYQKRENPYLNTLKDLNKNLIRGIQIEMKEHLQM